MKIELRTITPKQAQEWLDSAARNRNLSPTRIELYASMMDRGEWYQTGQGIALNSKGQLIDGQHRLAAIVKHGNPVQIAVATNVADAGQFVTDQGLKRRASDQISIQDGLDITPLHTAIAGEMIRSVTDTNAARATFRDILLLKRFYEQHHKAIEFAVSSFTRTVRGVTIAPVAAPIARAFYKHPQDRLRTFAELLVTGQSEQAGQTAAITLRNWLLAKQNTKDRISVRRATDRRLTYKHTERALKAFLNEERLLKLPNIPIETELFPIPAEREANRVVKLVKKAS